MLELADLNFEEYYRDSTRRAGGVVVDDGGVVAYAAPHWLPVLLNGALRSAAAGPSPSAGEVLARAAEFFEPLGRGFSINSRAHADADLDEAAAAAGFVADPGSPVMVCDARLDDRPPPDGVELRRVTDAAGAADFAAVNGAAYGTYGMPADVAPAMFSRVETLAAPHLAAFVAHEDGGAPLAGALVHLNHGVAGVYWVGTVPEARGRGLAETVTRAVTNAGFDLGARLAVLQASKMGEPVYRRMGYREVTRYRTWVRYRPRPGADDRP